MQRLKAEGAALDGDAAAQDAKGDLHEDDHAPEEVCMAAIAGLTQRLVCLAEPPLCLPLRSCLTAADPCIAGKEPSQPVLSSVGSLRGALRAHRMACGADVQERVLLLGRVFTMLAMGQMHHAHELGRHRPTSCLQGALAARSVCM